MSKLLFLRKSILSSLHLSEFSLNLFSLDQRIFKRRASCVVSWSIDAPNLGTFSETALSSANFNMEERVLRIVRSLVITKESHGPIRVPCGIPAETYYALDPGQPRLQGAFPWLWRWGTTPPKPGKCTLGTKLNPGIVKLYFYTLREPNNYI